MARRKDDFIPRTPDDSDKPVGNDDAVHTRRKNEIACDGLLGRLFRHHRSGGLGKYSPAEVEACKSVVRYVVS